MQVFISYDPTDEAFYQALAARLREAGVETSPSARATTSRANKVLQRADALIVLLSGSGLSSVRVRSQALWFFTLTEINATKRLVPVWIGGKPIPPLWPFLNSEEVVVRGDSTDDDEDFIARICGRLDVIPPAATEPHPRRSADIGPELPTIQLPPIPPLPPISLAQAAVTPARRSPWPLLAVACVVLVSLLGVGFMLVNGKHTPGEISLAESVATRSATVRAAQATRAPAVYVTTSPTASATPAATRQPQVLPTGSPVATVTPVATATPVPPVLVLAINAGSQSAVGTFKPDGYFSGGNTYANNNPIDTTNQVNPAPTAVYQSERYCAGRENKFSYNVPNVQPGHVYTVRLHFAEIWFSSTGQRIFNVNINGQPVLTDFDIVAEAGGPNKAIIKAFAVAADNTGMIRIDFLQGKANNSKVSGIEIFD